MPPLSFPLIALTNSALAVERGPIHSGFGRHTDLTQDGSLIMNQASRSNQIRAANGTQAESTTPPGDDPGERTASDALAERRIPPAVVKRLSLYSRALSELERDKVEKVSSSELGALLGLNSAQVRKDLAYFGQFGVPGFGYPVADLRRHIKSILGTDREIRVALIGVGHLGTALLSYGGFRRQGFRIMCAFDREPRDPTVGEEKIPVFNISELEKRVEELGVDFAILTTPSETAQELTDRMVAAGITAILNFVPRRLDVPDHVMVHYVDLAIEMESLSFYIR